MLLHDDLEMYLPNLLEITFPSKMLCIFLWEGEAYSGKVHHFGMGNKLVGSPHLDRNKDGGDLPMHLD